MNKLPEPILDVIYRNTHEMLFRKTIEKIQEFNPDNIKLKYLLPRNINGWVTYMPCNNGLRDFCETIKNMPNPIIKNLYFEEFEKNNSSLLCTLYGFIIFDYSSLKYITWSLLKKKFKLFALKYSHINNN